MDKSQKLDFNEFDMQKVSSGHPRISRDLVENRHWNARPQSSRRSWQQQRPSPKLDAVEKCIDDDQEKQHGRNDHESFDVWIHVAIANARDDAVGEEDQESWNQNRQ